VYADLLGSAAFKVVQSDLTGNIAVSLCLTRGHGYNAYSLQKIRARQLAAPDQSATLEDLVTNEVASDKKRPATQGLLWLNRYAVLSSILSRLQLLSDRGLSFTSLALRRSATNPEEELSVSFNKAYEGSLKQYHSFIVRPVFAVSSSCCFLPAFKSTVTVQLAMKACPYRADFYQKLDSTPEEQEAWLSGLEAVVQQINGILTPTVVKGL
jgi:hypothetical protein